MEFRNQKGFSLVGILVGVSLLGLLTLGMMSVFSNMLKNQNFGKFRTEVENFGEEFRVQLGSEAICTATFSGTLLNPAVSVTKPLIKDASGNTVYSTNTDMGDHSFKIASMDLKSSPTAPWYVEDDPVAGTGRMTLTVNYQALMAQSGAKDAFRTYVLSTRRDATGKLVSCSALAKMSDGIWRYNTSTASSIYYVGGNVGIGTTTPTSTLQNVGSLGLNYVVITNTSYAVKETDHVIVANPAAAATMTLPTAVGIGGRIYTVKNNSLFTVTILPSGSEKIDGGSNFLLNAQYQNVSLMSDGSNWNVVSTIASNSSAFCSGATEVKITADANNVNLFSLAGSPTSPGKWQFTINNGVVVSSADTTTPAMDTGIFPAGSTVCLLNRGFILGRGGAGGSGRDGGVTGSGATGQGPQPGKAGGTALVLNYPVTISNQGAIWGGGGGGGGGG